MRSRREGIRIALNANANLPVDTRRPYVFVCYAHEQRDVVTDQIRWLREQGIEVWYDDAIEGGSRWSEDLAVAVEGCAAVLFFLSPRSAGSRYCLDEISFALDCGRPIIPVEIEPVALTPGLRLSLGGTHRLFMHRMQAGAFRDKLGSAIRAALEGRPVQPTHGDADAVVRAPQTEAAGEASTRWRPVVAGLLAALLVFVLLTL
jgi:hypothetical protein